MREKHTIHWTSFQFPPKKSKKLDDILNSSVREDSVLKTKESMKAIKLLQQKAINCGIFKAPKQKYFYDLEDETGQAEKEVL